MADQLKVVFMGTPSFAVPSLQSLLNGSDIEIQAVYTQPDRSAGRGQDLGASPVKVFAEQNKLEIRQPENLDPKEFKNLKPDFIVVVAYGILLPKEVLELPKYGCINLHASLLPKHRGASPIQAAILNGDTTTGVSIMQITEKLDSGPVFEQVKVGIGDKNAEELGTELAKVGGAKLPEVLKKIAAGKLAATKQSPAEATCCHKVRKTDGKADWENDTTETLLCKLRAYTPWPGVWTIYNGKVLKLNQFFSFQFSVSSDLKSGTIFESNGIIGVKTVDGAIELQKVQLAGKKVLEVTKFVHGESDFVGSQLV